MKLSYYLLPLAAALGLSAALLTETATAQAAKGPCEARTPIRKLPYTITECGSYYITRDLTGVAGQNGITVLAENVTIDLNGFALTGVPGSLDGIEVPIGSPARVRLKNGTISEWGGVGVDLVRSSSMGSMLLGLRVESNGSRGIYAPDQTMVIDCIVTDNGNQGMQVGGASLVDGCTAQDNTYSGIVFAGAGGIVRRCTARQNGSDGIGQNSGFGWMLSENVCALNARDGISVTTAAMVRENNCAQNTGAGIALRKGRSYTTGNLVSNNAIGIEAQTINHEVVVRNVANGNTTNFAGTGGTNDFGIFGSAAGSTIHWNNISH